MKKLSMLVLFLAGCLTHNEAKTSAEKFTKSLGLTPTTIVCDDIPGNSHSCVVIVSQFPQPLGMLCFEKFCIMAGGGQ